MRTPVLLMMVDNNGHTLVDEFDTSIPLDMDALPERYIILPFTRCNAHLAAELFKENCDGQQRVMLACPRKSCSATDFEAAKFTIRELIFECPPPQLGGLRRMREIDYVSAAIIGNIMDERNTVRNALRAESPDDRPPGELYSVTPTATPLRLSMLASHGLWKRLRWIDGVTPVVGLSVIWEIVDPTWWVNHDEPLRINRFLRRCGVYATRPTAAPPFILWANMMSPYVKFLSGKHVCPDDLAGPDRFFTRYALHILQKALDEGDPVDVAINESARHYMRKLGGYIFLNWMEIVHSEPPQRFDAARFFLGDEEVIQQYNSACL